MRNSFELGTHNHVRSWFGIEVTTHAAANTYIDKSSSRTRRVFHTSSIVSSVQSNRFFIYTFLWCSFRTVRSSCYIGFNSRRSTHRPLIFWTWSLCSLPAIKVPVGGESSDSPVYCAPNRYISQDVLNAPCLCWLCAQQRMFGISIARSI